MSLTPYLRFREVARRGEALTNIASDRLARTNALVSMSISHAPVIAERINTAQRMYGALFNLAYRIKDAWYADLDCDPPGYTDSEMTALSEKFEQELQEAENVISRFDNDLARIRNNIEKRTFLAK